MLVVALRIFNRSFSFSFSWSLASFFIFLCLLLLDNGLCFGSDAHLFGRDDTFLEVTLNQFEPADIVHEVFTVGKHLLTVMDRKESNFRVRLTSLSVFEVQRSQPSAVDMDELVDMSLPEELLSLLEPLELLGIGMDIHIEEVLQSLLVSLSDIRILVSELSEVKNAVE